MDREGITWPQSGYVKQWQIEITEGKIYAPIVAISFDRILFRLDLYTFI